MGKEWKVLRNHSTIQFCWDKSDSPISRIDFRYDQITHVRD